jgi:sterol desaturase/sphingolipid hydroxylase (fatty acid hydroxylase superfamily)
LWIALATILVFALAFALELSWARRHAGDPQVTGFSLRDTLASGAVGLGSIAVETAMNAPTIAALAVVYDDRLFDLGDAWWAWIAVVFAQDLCYYAFHRASHRVRLLWAAHVNHHSSERFNLSTALRQSWTSPLVAPIFYLPLGLVGFSPAMVMTAQLISAIQFANHTEAIRSLGPLEWVLNTPSHHRVHHGSDARYLDKNFGGIFIIWDRLLGTFEPERERPHYGLTANIATYNPVRIAFHEWRALIRDVRAARWRDKLATLYRPPRWRPE